MQSEVDDFNTSNNMYKKGMALMPICFGISFTKTLMNQARSLVHVYTDGSVGVSTGAVEMGQGVNTKMLQVAAQIFSINPAKVKIQSTSTFRIANTSPSAASATADLNGKAVEMACNEILSRLLPVAAAMAESETAATGLRDGYVWVNNKQTVFTWEQVVLAAYVQRINLSEHAHYSTPEIHFDAT